eukprot:8716813-Alexandrium_andersonii.AAC.1
MTKSRFATPSLDCTRARTKPTDQGKTAWALCAHSTSWSYRVCRASPASPVPTRLRHCPMRP